MNTCVIFCAGGFDCLAEPLHQSDVVMAADGGLKHLKKMGYTPDMILGDFDSLGYTPENASVFPEEKDDTDAILAVRQGLQLGYRRFVLYGALDGARLDHTLANLQLLQFLAEHGAFGYLAGLSYMATTIQNGTLRFSADAEGIISLFCLGKDASGVTLRGLKYPLSNATLTNGYPLGVSNRFLGREATVTVENGSLLVLYDRKNGFPFREA